MHLVASYTCNHIFHNCHTLTLLYVRTHTPSVTEHFTFTCWPFLHFSLFSTKFSKFFLFIAHCSSLRLAGMHVFQSSAQCCQHTQYCLLIIFSIILLLLLLLLVLLLYASQQVAYLVHCLQSSVCCLLLSVVGQQILLKETNCLLVRAVCVCVCVSVFVSLLKGCGMTAALLTFNSILLLLWILQRRVRTFLLQSNIYS